MPRPTRAARRQLNDLLDHFERLGRVEAAEHLIAAYLAAVEAIDADPAGGAKHPSIYASLASLEYRWIRRHRYWFAWANTAAGPVLTGIHFEAARMVGRISTERTIEDQDGPGG